MTAGSVRLAAIVAAILLVASLARILAVESGRLNHPDEVITTAVVEQLRKSGSLDTNFKHADLPDHFRMPQYNFSGFHLTVHAVSIAIDSIVGKPGSPEEALHRYRLLNVAFSIAALVLVAWIGLTLFGTSAAIIAVALAAMSPSLVMDGVYARPDSFATLLSLALLAVFLNRNRVGMAWGPIAGLLVGFLVAVKISFLLFCPLPLLWALSFDRQPRDGAGGNRFGIKASPVGILVAGASMVLGFALGAPGALANFGDYLAGVRTLQEQYGSGHWPHGLGHEANIMERLLYGGRFLWETWGLALLPLVVGCAALWKRRQWDVLFALAPFVAMLAYFVSTPVFFERNFSPALAALAPVAGLGVVEASRYLGDRFRLPGPWSAGAGWMGLLAALSLAVPMLVTGKVLAAILAPGDLEPRRKELGGRFDARLRKVDWDRPPLEGAARSGKGSCDKMLVEIRDPGDPGTLTWLANAAKKGWVEVARHRSYFSGMVPSTFHTYLETDTAWLVQTPDADPGCLVPLVDVPVQADDGWRKDGVFPGLPQLPAGGDVFGSWVDSDRSTGAIVLGPVRTCEAVELPYMTGPDSTRQALTVEVWNDQFKAAHRPQFASAHAWSYFRVPVPAECAWVKITGVDFGSGWGEWMALGVPHRIGLRRAAQAGS